MNQKLGFLPRHTQHSPIILAKLGYSRIKINHITDSLLKLQIKIGVHLINAKLLQLLTLFQPKSTSCKFTRIQQQSSLEKRANNSRAKNSRPPTGMVFDNSFGTLVAEKLLRI